MDNKDHYKKINKRFEQFPKKKQEFHSPKIIWNGAQHY